MAELGVWHGAERARLVRLCAAISGDREAAEDLAQETLLEAWRHRHKLRDPGGADRWLAAIARNVCRRWTRTRSRLPLPLDALPEPSAPPEDGVVDLLELLPPATREVMVRRYVHDLSHGEIAAALGISGDAVSMRLTRGKHALRRILAEAEWRPSTLPCPLCGGRKLLLRRDAGEVAFTCPDCSPRELLVRYPLGNPQFARLVGGLERPSWMLRRVGDWALGYFRGGAGSAVTCTRCGARVGVVAHTRSARNPGLFVRCGMCGEEVWTSLAGLAAAEPLVRELRRRRVAGTREERGALLIVHQSLDGARTVTTAFDRRTFRLLGSA